MTKYLGETPVDVAQTEYANYTPKDWALFWIMRYGGIDGSHHKDWVLDHVVRLLNGTKVIIKLAKWDDGTEEYRFTLDEPTLEYHEWVRNAMAGEDGPNTYGYEVGIAP